jgi:hypothetical protein
MALIIVQSSRPNSPPPAPGLLANNRSEARKRAKAPPTIPVIKTAFVLSLTGAPQAV